MTISKIDIEEFRADVGDEFKLVVNNYLTDAVNSMKTIELGSWRCGNLADYKADKYEQRYLGDAYCISCYNINFLEKGD